MFVADCLSVNPIGHLAIGGLDVLELAAQYGTPLYIMDEDNIRQNLNAYQEAMRVNFGVGNFAVAYASKAFCTGYMYKILKEEGASADVVSGGELYTAMKADFPAERLYFHGNNKTYDELDFAIRANTGRIVVDNFEELIAIDKIAKGMTKRLQISCSG